MADKRMVKWLFEQLPEWVENGLINEDQVARLEAHYGSHLSRPDSRVDPGIIAISIVGALLIVGGVLSIVAYNWEQFGQSVRLFISFIPVALGLSFYLFTFLKKKESLAWRESATGVLLLTLGSTIALYLQTMGTDVNEHTLVRPWMILSIPIVYGMGSSLGMLIYFYLITVWALGVSRPESAYYWLLISAAFPHLWRYFRQPGQAIRKQLLSWGFVLSWTFGWFAATPWHAPEYTILGAALWLSVFGGLSFFMPGISEGTIFKNPFRFAALAGIFILVIMGSFKQQQVMGFSFQGIWKDSEYTAFTLGLNAGLLAVFAGLWGLVAVRMVKEARIAGSEWLVWSFPIFAAIYVVLAGNFSQSSAGMATSNLFGVALGMAYVWKGVTRYSLSALNTGLLFILGLAVQRFFDSNWSLVVKGVAFIFLGMLFLSVNVYFARRRKSSHGGNAAAT